MLKMSDTLTRLTRPHGALLNFEEEDAILEGSRQSELYSAERILAEEAKTDL